jgi:ATP-dependent Lon protease
MSFHTVEHLDEVLELALVGGLKALEAMPIVDGKKAKPKRAPRVAAAPA